MNEKVLLLDFDGVVHPTLAQPSALFIHGARLAEVLSSYPVNIVISSSWRFHFSKKVGIPDHRDRSFRAIVTADSDAS